MASSMTIPRPFAKGVSNAAFAVFVVITFSMISIDSSLNTTPL